MHENFGLESYEVLQLSQKVDIIVNGAATTNFMERYIYTYHITSLSGDFNLLFPRVPYD